ncbi:MAG TPA: hypothetical protein VFX97_11690 [Pyrinomonadaceae bacterium]|nr:hypothetical protein [Pyrinomonadaceae bacterium]
MEDAPTIEQTKAFATGMYQGAQLVADYMKDRWPTVNGVIVNSQTGHRDVSMKGLWGRAHAWMQTVKKLNDPLDFQATAVANRALLEITVDLTLLHQDKTNASGWKMHWWGESQKMKSAEQIIRFYQENGLDVPDQFDGQVEFVRNSKSSIDHMRTVLWPNKRNPKKPTHPERWTGKPTLFEDIQMADVFYASQIEADLGSSLTEYYRTEYAKMNWRIHSGVAAFWNQPPQSFNLVSAFAFKWCADFGMLCTKIVLTDFGLTAVLDNLRQQWEDIRTQRELLCLQHIKNPSNQTDGPN